MRSSWLSPGKASAKTPSTTTAATAAVVAAPHDRKECTVTAVTTMDTKSPDALCRGASVPASSLNIAWRTVLKFVRTPQLIVAGTIQGAMFLLIFRYVFGGAINIRGIPYVDFLVPGFITTG